MFDIFIAAGHGTLKEPHALDTDAPGPSDARPMHHAFTSLVFWRGSYDVAYREAPSHGIMPPGVVKVLCFPHERFSVEEWDDGAWSVHETTLHL